jgi:hypothetical protein
MVRTGFAVGLLCLAFGCGSVQTEPDAPPGNPDAPPGTADARPPDASPPDASPPDAMPTPTLTLINSAVDFPNPSSIVTAFTAADLAPFGITAMNVNGGAGTSIVGNTDAPISSSIFIHSSPLTQPTFTFGTPITAIGISVYDADYGNDNPVIIRIAAIDMAGGEIAANQRALTAANAQAEQNAGAIFVGFSYSVPFSRVQITIDQANSTGFDNMKFR